MNVRRMLRQRSRRRAGHASGQALVEMVLIVTILLTLTASAIDFGFCMYFKVEAANCAREAARRAVVRDPNAASPGYCVSGLQPTLSPASYMTLPAGDPVTASVNYTYNWMALNYFIPGLGDTIQVQSQTTMKMEGQKA